MAEISELIQSIRRTNQEITDVITKMLAKQDEAKHPEVFLAAQKCSKVAAEILASSCITALCEKTELTQKCNEFGYDEVKCPQESNIQQQYQNNVVCEVVNLPTSSLATSEVADVDNHTDVDMCSEEAVDGHIISSDVCEALQDSLSGQTIKKDSVTIDFLDGTLTRRRCHETRVAALPNRVVEGSMNQLGPSALENVCSEQCQKLCDVAKISFATVDAASVKYSDTSVKCVNADELGGPRSAGTGVWEMPPPPHSLTHPLSQSSGQETEIVEITTTTTTTAIGSQEMMMMIESPMMKTTIAGNKAAVVAVINTGGRSPPHPSSHAAIEAATVATATSGWPRALDTSASVFTDGAAGVDIQDSGGRRINFSVNQSIKSEDQLYAAAATVTGGRASYGCQLGWSAFEEIWPEQGQDFCEVAKVSVPGVGDMFRSQDTIFSCNAGKSQDAGLSGLQIPPPHAHQPLTHRPSPIGKKIAATVLSVVGAVTATTGSLSTLVHEFNEGTSGVDILLSLFQVDKCSVIKVSAAAGSAGGIPPLPLTHPPPREKKTVAAATSRALSATATTQGSVPAGRVVEPLDKTYLEKSDHGSVGKTAVHGSSRYKKLGCSEPTEKTGVGTSADVRCVVATTCALQCYAHDLKYGQESSWARRIAVSVPYLYEKVNVMNTISYHVMIFDGGTVYESYLENLVNVIFDTDHMSRVLNKNVRHGDSGNHIIVYKRLDGGDHDNVDCSFLINICDTFIEYGYHKSRLSNNDTSVANRNYFTLDILVDNDNLLGDDNMSVKYEDSMFSNNDIDNKNVIIWLIKFIVMFINLIKWVTYVWVIISHNHLKSVELF